ncbi:MAG: hypothetical protein A2X31_04705 [Elusimicrobia bacterium GWB2_63_22]|nr:MAG: hypothetical protein A2X31_04705 [Elusimicrobia bacterium GWB2_63_22]
MNNNSTFLPPDQAPSDAFEREKVSLPALLPALALTAGIVFSLFSKAGWNRYILPLEVFADLFIAFFAFRHNAPGARWWRVAAVALLAGDTFYMVGHQVPSFPAWAFMAQEAFYTLCRFMTAAYLYSSLRVLDKLETAEKVILAAASAVITFISIQYLIIPFFRSGNHATPFFYANAVLNRLAESAVFPLALLLGMKARSRYWLAMTHGLALISISSLAIGYYIALNAAAPGIPVQEYGWLCGLLLILAAQAYSSSGSAPFARWNSARVRLVLLVLLFNLALLLSLSLLQIFISKDAFQLTTILLVFFGLWSVANLIAFRISEDIYLLLGSVNAGAADGARPAYRVAIYEAELFAEKLKAAYDTIRSQTRLAALSALAAQVAHDIRSPLAALDTALKDVTGLPEEKRELISAAAGRIRDIADDLLKKNRQGAVEPPLAAGQLAPQLLPGLIVPVIEEKRLQYRGAAGVAIEMAFAAGASGLRARVDPAGFGRLLSNLVNNSVEALERGGRVAVGLARRGSLAAITVRDDGKGIPAELLGRLGGRGETHGKAGGSGLGLYHARTAVEAWGGSLAISSEPGKGTTVTISLPLSELPSA